MKKRTATGFAPFDPSLLQTDTVPDFDIYIWPESSALPVLYHTKNLPFQAENRNRIASLGESEMFAKVEDENAFLRYMEDNLDRIISDPSLPTEQKAKVLYQTSLQLAQDILARPDSKESLARSENVVRNTIGYILQGRDAFHHLLSLTAYDYYTYTHSVNVCTMGLALAAEVGLRSQSELMEFGVGALFHDVGKTKITASILRKRGPLTESEWQEMKRHPELGLSTIAPDAPFSDASKAVIGEHHEWVNGAGYPKGKKDGSIHPFAKVAAVVDVFDALTTRRAYKDAIGSFPALRVMQEGMGTHFDQECFEKFVRLLGK